MFMWIVRYDFCIFVCMIYSKFCVELSESMFCCLIDCYTANL